MSSNGADQEEDGEEIVTRKVLRFRVNEYGTSIPYWELVTGPRPRYRPSHVIDARTAR
jgi:hypothetical protein